MIVPSLGSKFSFQIAKEASRQAGRNSPLPPGIRVPDGKSQAKKCVSPPRGETRRWGFLTHPLAPSPAQRSAGEELFLGDYGVFL